jgi:malate dehydrogenase (oxaloacetate-decarboxylating)
MITNFAKKQGSLSDAMVGADIFIGVSKGEIVSSEMVQSMNSQPIIFALANPVPEIMPDLAKSAGASVVATGRSDFPNQINNVLAFPGIFRGALDNEVKQITDSMLIAAAEALAACVSAPSADKVLPGPFEPGIAAAVAQAIR